MGFVLHVQFENYHSQFSTSIFWNVYDSLNLFFVDKWYLWNDWMNCFKRDYKIAVVKTQEKSLDEIFQQRCLVIFQNVQTVIPKNLQIFDLL